jgi:hypothetical protein
MIDRNFEEIWQTNNGQVPNGFCLLLHVANFGDLHTNSYIDLDDIEGSVARFEGSLESLFHQAPHDTNGLRNAFMRGELLGKRVTSFRSPLSLEGIVLPPSMNGLLGKYDALRSYLMEG